MFLKLNIELKRASNLKEKYTFKTQGRYEWFDEEKPDETKEYTTKIVEKSRTPDFQYKNSHMVQIDEAIVKHM